MRVLLIEDEPTNVALLTVRLEALGCQVLTTDEPDGALALAEAERPDLVFLDLKLGNDLWRGGDLLGTLKASPVVGDVPVVIHSVFAAHPDEAPMPLPEAAGYLPKPFRFAELKELISRFEA